MEANGRAIVGHFGSEMEDSDWLLKLPRQGPMRVSYFVDVTLFLSFQLFFRNWMTKKNGKFSSLKKKSPKNAVVVVVVVVAALCQTLGGQFTENAVGTGHGGQTCHCRVG